MGKVVLSSGKNVYARPLSVEDASGGYLKWFNDPEVMKYSSNGRFPMSRGDLEKFVLNSFGDRSKIIWAIVHKESDLHIGNMSLQSIDWVDRSAEFAIIIGEKSFWGKGVGSEAAKLMIDFAFEKLNLARVYCGTAAENIGMQKLALALGMQKEGVRRRAVFLEGKYQDLVEFGVLRDEYPKR